MRLKIFITAILVGTASLILAQPSKKGRKEGHQAARKAMKAYAEGNIIPVIKPIREDFDNKLSTAEQKELVQVRAALKAEKEKMQEKRKSMKGEFKDKGERPRPSEAQIEEMRAMKNEHRKLMTRVWAIADNHEAELDQIRTELKPNMEIWRKEMKALKEANRPVLPEGAENERAHKGKRGEGAPHGHREEGMEKGRRGGPEHHGRAGGNGIQKLMSPVGFLLWDTTQPLEEPVELTSVKTFPNPTKTISNLEFTLNTTGPVTVKLINEQGVTIKTLINETREAGTYTLETNLSELEKGLYFYQIKTEAGLSTQKVLVDK